MKKREISFSSLLKPFWLRLQNAFGKGGFGKMRIYGLALILIAVGMLAFVFPATWNRGADYFESKTGVKLFHLRETSMHFGLDLLGGTHLVYEADTSKIPFKDQEDAVDGARDVIERRVNVLGVSEPLVQKNFSGDKWRVIVELAGVKDVGEAIRQIGETPILQFKEQSETSNRALTVEEQKELDDYNADALHRANEALSRVVGGEDFADLAFQLSEDDGSREKGGELDWFRESVMIKEFADAVKSLKPDGAVRKILLKTQFGYHIIKKIGEREIVENDEPVKEYNAAHILIKTKSERDFLTIDDYWKDTELSGKHLERASVQFDPNTNVPEVSLDFNSEGKELFKEITERNVGKYVGVFLDGQPVTIPRVSEAIYDGSARITGDYSFEEAKLMAQRLNAGALPIPITLVSQQTVGATLGKLSVSSSLFAGLIGFALVCLFMVLYYRLAGVMSVLALAFYGALMLALFKFVPVTLTLSGIAGFILSIGMAVDANVLIFERLREELAEGKDLHFAIDEAFKRAWPSIRDGNVSTLITALILFWFSASLIKGFALTLSLGVIMSMFTAMVVSKVFLTSAVGLIKNNWWIGKKSKVKSPKSKVKSK